MGVIRDQANLIYANGPSTSPSQPPKEGLRDLFQQIDTTIEILKAATGDPAFIADFVDLSESKADPADVAKKARLPNLFTNGNLDPDGAPYVLFDELLATNNRYLARPSAIVPIVNTVLNPLGCNFGIDVPINNTSIGNAGNKLTQLVNLEGDGIFFSLLVFSVGGTWDFGSAFTQPVCTIRYSDGTQNSALLVDYVTVGTNVRRYFGYRAIATGKIATRIELGVDSTPPRSSRFILTGFWASHTKNPTISIQDTEYPDWGSKRNYPAALSRRVDKLEKKTNSEALRAALGDDMNSVSICLIGDSQTWGVGASGTSVREPRSGALSDPRNTVDEAVSPTWANLLIGHLARSFCAGTVSSPAPGVAEMRKTTVLDVCYDTRFRVEDIYVRGPRPKVVQERTSGPLMLRNLDIPFRGALNDALCFEFTGDQFTIVHALLGGTVSATFTVEVDGVVVGSEYQHGMGNSWGAETLITVPFGFHRVRIWTNSDSIGLRLEAIKHNRLVRVRNQGIIGRDSANWLPEGALYPGIDSGDGFVIAMIGTNDRVFVSGRNNHPDRLRRNLQMIGNQLKSDGKKLILMTPPRPIPDYPELTVYRFDAQDASNAIRQAAVDLDVPVIDNFAALAVVKDDSLLSDGLHQNDAGHRALFHNVLTSLGLIGGAQA
jgi:lysophospholipase L1-like esterase